jgi:tRNA modification GTPase
LHKKRTLKNRREARVDGCGQTIVARATPAGKGAIAVVRLSGPEAYSILRRVVVSGKKDLKRHPREMIRGWVVNESGQKIDEVLFVFMPGPHSFTGEDVVEIHSHGSDAVADAIVEIALRAGARPAGAGEFTHRALLSGRIDLSKAEAIARMIEARSNAEARGACRLLGGELERTARKAKEALVEAMAYFEARIEYPDDLSQEDQGSPPPIQGLEKDFISLLSCSRRQGEEDLEIVIAGPPNVGKSSLLNALSGREAAIVTEQAGTTRDAVLVPLLLRGERVVLVDTAGLSEPGTSEVAGIQAQKVSRKKIDQAALVLWVTDNWERLEIPNTIQGPVLLLLSKSDLLDPQEKKRALARVLEKGGVVFSSVTQEGMETLIQVLESRMEELFCPADGLPLTVRQRHAIEQASHWVKKGQKQAERGSEELALEEWRKALNAIGEILGEDLDPEVLDAIFSTFCIGK